MNIPKYIKKLFQIFIVSVKKDESKTNLTKQLKKAAHLSLNERYHREGRYADSEGRRESSAISTTRHQIEKFDNIDDPVEYSAHVLESIDHNRLFKYGLGSEVYEGRGIYGSIYSNIHDVVMQILTNESPSLPLKVSHRIDEIYKENIFHLEINYKRWTNWFHLMYQYCKKWNTLELSFVQEEAKTFYSLEMLKILAVYQSKSYEFECILDDNPRKIGTIRFDEELGWFEAVEKVVGKENEFLENDLYGMITSVYLPRYTDIYIKTHLYEIKEEHEDWSSYESYQYIICSDIKFELLRASFKAYIKNKIRPFIPGVKDVAHYNDWVAFLEPSTMPPYSLEKIGGD